MGAVFMTGSYSALGDREIKDLISLKASRTRTFTSPSIIRSTSSITSTASRTGALLCQSPSSHSDSNEPLILPLHPMPCPTPALLPTFTPTPALPPAPVVTDDITTDVAVPLSTQRGSLTETEINPVLSNVAEDSDEDDVQGTNIPVGAPSTSQSDGILCLRAKQVVVFGKEQEQQKQKQQQHHSQHHHHHHRHNHSYHGLQQPKCCARLGSGDSGASGGKHRLHSNSCVLV